MSQSELKSTDLGTSLDSLLLMTMNHNDDYSNIGENEHTSDGGSNDINISRPSMMPSLHN